MYGICQVSDFSYTPAVLQNLHAFYKIACASGSAARNNERGGVGRNSFAVRFGVSYLHRVGLKSEHEKLDTYVAYRLDGDS